MVWCCNTPRPGTGNAHHGGKRTKLLHELSQYETGQQTTDILVSTRTADHLRNTVKPGFLVGFPHIDNYLHIQTLGTGTGFVFFNNHRSLNHYTGLCHKKNVMPFSPLVSLEGERLCHKHKPGFANKQKISFETQIHF